jgi:hypothetical protein
MTNDLPDGIYFDLPHDEYVRLPRLGSSSINDLRTSPATFWMKSWLNPNRAADETHGRDPKSVGTAYHMARLEPERFAETYARGFDVSDHPEALRTDTEVCAVLSEMGETQRKKGEDALTRAVRLRSAGYEGEIASLLEAQHNAEMGDKLALAPEVWDNVQVAMRLIRNNSDIAALLTGGMSEVSVLWTENGVPMRARLDYLRADGWADVKSFSNPYGKPVDQCIVDAFRFNRYYVQAALYDRGVEAIRRGELEIMDEPPALAFDITQAMRRAQSALPCHYVFVQSDGSANILARNVRLRAPVRGVEAQAGGAGDLAAYMTQPSRLMMKGSLEVDYAVKRYEWGLEVHDDGEPWGPNWPVGDIGDDDYHDNFLDGDGR